MFVTLKASKNAREGVGMEQVSLSSARQDSARNRFGSSRRDACIACRSKKVRCTGLKKSCDRCITQQVACIFSSEPRARARKGRTAAASNPHRSGTDAGLRDSFDSSLVPQVETASGSSSINVPQDSNSITHQGLVGGEPAPQQPPRLANMGELCGQDSYSALELESPRQVNMLDAVSTPTASSDASGGSISSNVLHSESTRNSVISPPSIYGDFMDPFITDKNQSFPDLNTSYKSTHDSQPSDTNPKPKSVNSTACSCIEDMLEIVQKLDDDEFKLRTLGFDLVLKLQKWMVFHCCKPLDCPKCLHLPTTFPVILIICNRIANMFQCLSRRIKRQLASATGLDDDGAHTDHPTDNPTQSADPALILNFETPITASTAQLLDGSTASIPCTAEMFSPEFECQYSYEERLHMIRVLVKLQVRNFNQLLVRISEMPQSQQNQARAEKVMDLVNRLHNAAFSIDETFGKIIENLVG